MDETERLRAERFAQIKVMDEQAEKVSEHYEKVCARICPYCNSKLEKYSGKNPSCKKDWSCKECGKNFNYGA